MFIPEMNPGVSRTSLSQLEYPPNVGDDRYGSSSEKDKMQHLLRIFCAVVQIGGRRLVQSPGTRNKTPVCANNRELALVSTWWWKHNTLKTL